MLKYHVVRLDTNEASVLMVKQRQRPTWRPLSDPVAAHLVPETALYRVWADPGARYCGHQVCSAWQGLQLLAGLGGSCYMVGS